MPKFVTIVVFLTGSVVANAQLSPDQVEARFRLLEERIRQLEAELAAVKGEAAPRRDPEPPPETQAAAPPLAPTPEVLPMAEVIPTAGAESDDFYAREFRMPFSGYMDYHFNKPEGESDLVECFDHQRNGCPISGAPSRSSCRNR